MNWPQFLLPSPILITIARVNYYKAERRKWVQGIQMQGLMGWDGNWAAEVDAHRLSSGGYWRNLLVEEEFSTWNNCHSLCLHCAPDCRSTAGKMKQELTEAPNANADLCTYKRTHTQAHTICIYGTCTQVNSCVSSDTHTHMDRVYLNVSSSGHLALSSVAACHCNVYREPSRCFLGYLSR